MKVTITHLKKEGACLPQKTLSLKDQPITLGRRSFNKFRIPWPWISRVHCLIYKEGDKVFLRDRGSKNSTKLNGKRIPWGFKRVLGKVSLIQLADQKFKVEIGKSQ